MVNASFIDARWISNTYSLSRRLARSLKPQQDPLIDPGGGQGAIRRDGTRLRVWYSSIEMMSLPGSGKAHMAQYIRYAETTDGVTFDFPQLGVRPHTVPPDNIVIGPDDRGAQGRPLAGCTGTGGLCVVDAIEAGAPAPPGRYVALTKANRDIGGLWLICSEDGLRWRACLDRPVIPGWSDTYNNFFFDKRIGRWVIYTRPSIVAGPPRANRLIARRESDDLVHWDEEHIVLETDDRDAAAVGTVVETPGVPPRGRDRQFYGLTVTPWNGLYLGFAVVYDVVPGTMWCELVHSYDGIGWRREASREAFIAPGNAGEWDCGMIGFVPAGNPVAAGEDLYVYYEGMNYTHHEALDRHGTPGAIRGIGAVRFPFGRLVGYVSDEVRGELLTNTFSLDGLPLRINANALDGPIVCSICSPDGAPMPGYTEQEAHPIAAVNGCAEVHYAGGRSLGELIGKRVRLRIAVERATVYGFSTGRSEPEA